MGKIIYRDLVKDDYDYIKNLIMTAFGFNEFIKDEKFLDLVLTLYLKECVFDSSFSKVAEKDNKVIGVILGNSKEDENKLDKYHQTLNIDPNELKEAFIASNENKESMNEFLKIKEAYDNLMTGRENDFEGSIQLFIVSEECRGLGIGKALMNYLYEYMKERNVESMYLYTDTRCNYGFYDSQGFERIETKEVLFESINMKLDVFLYGYKFK